jgi:peroxiredoxin
MKKSIFLLLTMLYFFSCTSAHKGCEISGTLKNISSDTPVYLANLGAAAISYLDTAKLDKDGNFKMTKELKQKSLYALQVGKSRLIYLILDSSPATINITADTNDYSKFSYKITGSPASEQLRSFMNGMRDRFSSMMAMQKQLMDTSKSVTDTMRKDIQAKIMAASMDGRNYLTKYLDTTKNNVLAIFAAFNFLNPQNDLDLITKISARMKDDSSAFVKNFVAQIAQMTSQQPTEPKAAFAVGQQVPDISLPDPEGKVRNLSDLRGKYVLLDFWASWCGPCRKENPNVVEAYNKWKDKGFTIYSVSLDDTKSKWTDAIQQDKLSWPDHVSELKGWQSQICQLYQVSYIPQNYLLDKDGKVLAFMLRGDSLEQALEQYIK